MSAIAIRPSPSFRSVPDRPLAALFGHQPLFGALGLFMLMLVPPTLAALALDQRTLSGENVWMKPLKFELALAIYLLSLAFFARFIPAGTRERRWFRIYAGVVAAAIVLEIGWLGAAAALGVPSHFNASALGELVYRFMGVAAVVLTTAAAVFGVLIWRNGESGLSPALREGLALGLLLTLPLTLVTAGFLGGQGGHHVGEATGAPGLWLMGWSREVGDLRVAHFFATHAMHAVPAFALVSAGLPGGSHRAAVRGFAAAYVLFVGFTFAQALTGQPFLPMVG